MACEEDLRLIWIDLEMTGLDPEVDRIIEIATIVTDHQLNVLEEGPVMAIRQPKAVLDSMDEWNTSHHTQSGLVDRVLESSTSEQDAERKTIKFLEKYVKKGISPMCGNSIGQDRRFLVKYMPELESFFHYRNLDVSSVKELAKRWAPEGVHTYVKENKHLALDDIRESILELNYYRAHLFNTTCQKKG